MKTLALNKVVEYIPSIHDIFFCLISISTFRRTYWTAFVEGVSIFDLSNDYLLVNLYIYLLFML